MANGKPDIEFSLVIPCLNEAGTIEACIRTAQKEIRAKGLKAEILVADNGSTDGSESLAERCGAQVLSVARKGYGSALMGGIAASRGKYILIGDADGSHDFSQISAFLPKLREGYDLVVGCRFRRGGGSIMPKSMSWLHRYIGNPLLSLLGRIFFKAPVSDFHCGFRAFPRETVEQLDLRTTGMEFASEMVIKATLKGMKIAEVPITHHKEGRQRPPHLRTWRDGWRHLRFMLMYSPRWLFLIPGLILLLLGGVFSTLLMSGPLTLGSLTLDTNALLLSMMGVFIGFQLVAFAMFTKVFAISEGLLPQDPRLDRIFRFITLEVGILIGLVLLIVGAGLLSWIILRWTQHDFTLDFFPDNRRWFIPGATFLALGIGVIFSSFFMSILGLRRK